MEFTSYPIVPVTREILIIPPLTGSFGIIRKIPFSIELQYSRLCPGNYSHIHITIFESQLQFLSSLSLHLWKVLW